MIITNHYNLPEQIVRAVTQETREPKDNVISVTELIGPSWIRKLKYEYWNELEEDASERLYALMGQSVHYVFGKHELPDSFAEERLSITFGNYTITGQADNYKNDTQTIEDWKVTSVWSFLHGIKAEWEAQLNIYAYIWRQNGFDVKSLCINAILRDWQVGRSHSNDYPNIPFVTVPVPLWRDEYIAEYISARLIAHANPRECTPDEKWAKEDVFAVMKEGRKSAVKLHDMFQEAKEHAEALGVKHSVVRRPGEFVRCKSYCPVRKICEFNKTTEVEP